MTKQLNKKGTSLVELIAVIVIMGIIAGIAIPTTITVIDRQKQNAAIKSAETVYTAAKEVLMEASADENSDVIADALADGVVVDSTGDIFTVTNAGLATLKEIEKDPCKSGQTITIKFTASTNTFTVDATNVQMSNGKYVTWDTTKSVFKKGAAA